MESATGREWFLRDMGLPGFLAPAALDRRQLSVAVATLTLLGFTSAVLCFGDSIRGAGLGVLLELLTLGLMWDVAVRPTAMRAGAALIVAVAGRGSDAPAWRCLAGCAH